MTFFGFEIAAPAVGLGALLGMTYALLAVGLVLVYQHSRLVNFAHADIGVASAIILWVATGIAGVPYWLALPLTLALGAALAAVLERSVVHRLRRSPRAIAALATLGAGQLVFYIAATLLKGVGQTPFPQPSGVEPAHVGSLIVDPGEVLALIAGPLAIVALVFFMTKTPWGLALRAAAADPDLARVSGFASGRLSGVAWGLSGVLSALTAILLFGLRPGSSPESGFDLLVPTLAAASVARMTSLLVAGAAGFALGILQHLLLWNGIQGAAISIAFFMVIFVCLAVARRSDADLDKQTLWSPTLKGRRVALGRLSVPLLPVVTLTFGALVLSLVTPTDAIKLTVMSGFALLALSAAVVTGLSGQLILGQAAYAGFGAMASIAITLRTGNFFLGFLAASATGALVALLSSLPALRRRDLSLAVLSLAFAFASASWAFPQTWMFGSGIDPGRPVIGAFALTSAKSYAVFALTLLCLGLALGDVLWRSPLARQIVAQRDNPRAAASFGIAVLAVRAQAVLVMGAIAGVAGAVLAHAAIEVSPANFPVQSGVRVLGSAALGGITAVSGSLWGTAIMVGIPGFVGGVIGFIAASWAGWLLLIVTIPFGVAIALQRGPTAVPARPDPEEPESRRRSSAAPRLTREDTDGASHLEVIGCRVAFGELLALDDVDLSIRSSEVVGIVGRNGAGKSTLLDVMSGELRPTVGEVRLNGKPITDLSPSHRARLGIARAFEGAILFPTMTVLETTLMALEVPSADSVRGRPGRSQMAREIIEWVGLAPIADKRIGELSTGLRRMAQLACLCGRRPRVLLLDEPASGIAEAELDGLASILNTLTRDLALALVIVEHELRLVQKLASRVVVLDGGRMIAEGSPDSVLGSPSQG